MIYRKFISLILATAVAITGLTAAPARAADDDLLKLLAGVAAVAIIGTAIAKKRRNDDQSVSRGSTYRDDYRYDRDRYDHDRRRSRKHAHRRHHDHDSRARPLPHRVKRKLLPAGCHVTARTNRGQRFGAFGAQCLEKHYRYARSLPSQCVRKARLTRGRSKHYLYSGQCLSEYGYYASRR